MFANLDILNLSNNLPFILTPSCKFNSEDDISIVGSISESRGGGEGGPVTQAQIGSPAQYEGGGQSCGAQGQLYSKQLSNELYDLPGNKLPDTVGASTDVILNIIGGSDIDILRRHFKVNVKHINPRVVNRVNAMNKQFANNNILIDTSCKDLIGDLEKVTNKQGTREIDKSNKNLTHMTDAFGYSVFWEYPVVKPSIGTSDR